MKIDKTNYFLKTFGTFEICEEINEKIKDLKGNETAKLRKIYKDFSKNNKDWELNHISKNRGTNRIASIYFTNSKTNQLIRISNHWGGFISSCSWDIKGQESIICRKTKWTAGIINFDNLQFDNSEF